MTWGTGKSSLKSVGTSGFCNGNAVVGDAPCKNWGGVSTIDFPLYKNIALIR